MYAKDQDITSLAFMLSDRRITAVDLLRDQFDEIARRDADLCCFVEVDEAGATLAALESDQRRKNGAPLSALDGIPIALKDNINAKGLSTRNGSKYNHSVTADAAVTQKLRAAGAVLLGKLNMDECAIGGTTDNPHYGRTFNPWKPGFVPGGSSGGARAKGSMRAKIIARVCFSGRRRRTRAPRNE